jgi:hypothetical protein
LTPDEDIRGSTRRSLHAVAEKVMAGHQYRSIGTIRLAVRPDGFTSRDLPGVPGRLAVDGTDLVVDGRRLPLQGRLGELAAAAGVECLGPESVYPSAAELGPDDELRVGAAAAAELHGAWVLGDAVLRAFAGDHYAAGLEPVLWPEHLDVAITVDEVNYGVSPGDSGIEEPYAYVGPHRPLSGPFWTQPFGAALLLDGVSAGSLRAFFEEGFSVAARG